MFHRLTRDTLAALLVLAMATVSFAQDQAPKSKTGEKEKASRKELEKQFSERMANSVLVGRFTVDGQDAAPKTERYEIQSVTKTKDDYWTFLARIKYGKVDAKVPITVKILWAGDTPVVSLTDLTIPGLGTFTARVLFYEHRYAGTWQHGKVGGNLFGRIEKANANQ